MQYFNLLIFHIHGFMWKFYAMHFNEGIHTNAHKSRPITSGGPRKQELGLQTWAGFWETVGSDQHHGPDHVTRLKVTKSAQ